MKPKHLSTRCLSQKWFIQIESADEETLIDGDFRMTMRYVGCQLVELVLPDCRFGFERNGSKWHTTCGGTLDHLEWEIIEIAPGYHTLVVAGFSGGLWRI